MPALVDAANSMRLRFRTTLWNDRATHLLSLNEHGTPELVAQDACRGSETLDATLAVGRRQLQLAGRLPSHAPTHTPTRAAHALAVENSGAVLATQHRAAERLTLHVPSRRPLLLLAAHGPHVLQSDGEKVCVGAGQAKAASTWQLEHHGDDVYTLWQAAADQTPARAVMVHDDGRVELTANPAMLLPNTPCLLRVQLTTAPLPPIHDPSVAVSNPVAVGFALQTVRRPHGVPLYLSVRLDGRVAARRGHPTRCELFMPVDPAAWQSAGLAEALCDTGPAWTGMAPARAPGLLHGGEGLLAATHGAVGMPRRLRRLGGSAVNLAGSTASLASMDDGPGTPRSESRLALCGLPRDTPPGWGVCSPASLQTTCVRHLASCIASGQYTLAALQSAGLPDVLFQAVASASQPAALPPPTKSPIAAVHEDVFTHSPVVLFVCTACKNVHVPMDPAINTAHHRYLELARRRHYAPVVWRENGPRNSLAATVRAALGLTAAFLIGRVMCTAPQRRRRGG